MTRATVARVLARLGGEYPPPWTESRVSSLCTQADYVLDSFTFPKVLSYTDETAIEIAVELVMRMMRQADMLAVSAGTMASGGKQFPDIDLLSAEMRKRIKALLGGSTYYGATTVDLIEED